jgi:RNA polymerase sigma-70 factor (ECF subfamily)
MDEPPITRASLILRLRDPADAVAWDEFVALYEPLVYNLACHKGLQDADARDLCQDVLLAVARAVHRWDPDPNRGSFRGWLSRITRNLLGAWEREPPPESAHSPRNGTTAILA